MEKTIQQNFKTVASIFVSQSLSLTSQVIDTELGKRGQGGTEYRGPACFEGPGGINARKTFLRYNVQYMPAGWKEPFENFIPDFRSLHAVSRPSMSLQSSFHFHGF